MITLNGEIQRLKRDHTVALEKLKDKIRWQTFNQAAAERQTALIKKQVCVCVHVFMLLVLVPYSARWALLNEQIELSRSLS